MIENKSKALMDVIAHEGQQRQENVDQLDEAL